MKITNRQVFAAMLLGPLAFVLAGCSRTPDQPADSPLTLEQKLNRLPAQYERKTAVTLRVLEAQRVRLDFDDAPVGAVLAHVSDATGVPIRHAFEPALRITLRLPESSAREALAAAMSAIAERKGLSSSASPIYATCEAHRGTVYASIINFDYDAGVAYWPLYDDVNAELGPDAAGAFAARSTTPFQRYLASQGVQEAREQRFTRPVFR